jgi:hypothetical protein
MNEEHCRGVKLARFESQTQQDYYDFSTRFSVAGVRNGCGGE